MVAATAARLVLLAGLLAGPGPLLPLARPSDAATFPDVPTAPAEPLGLLDLTPGTDRAALEMRITQAGWTTAPFGRRGLLFSGAVVPELYADQRTLLEFDNQHRLRAAHVVIRLPDGSSGSEVMRLYGEFKSALLRRLGPANWERSSGTASSRDLLAALSEGRVVRFVQWDGPPCIRAGVPVRADGQVVLQVLVAAEKLDRGRTLWGRDDF